MNSSSSYLPRKHCRLQEEFHWHYLFRYLRLFCVYIFLYNMYIYICIYAILELRSVKRQSHFPLDMQKGIFWVKNNRHRRVSAWCHLETRQYVAQSGLHLHQSEPHSCEEYKGQLSGTSNCMWIYHLTELNRTFHLITCKVGHDTDIIYLQKLGNKIIWLQ
jgi:hypothetical protein